MSLIARAREDVKRITTNQNEWGVAMTLTAPAPGNETVNLVGLHTKHHTAVDTDGRPINAKNAHIGFYEEEAGVYPVRNAAGEVNLKGHKVTVPDSTGTQVTYMIREWYPDETIGLIVCILGDFV